ncbi:MAG: Uma2 family endonuclease [Gemmataceae bacterium]|nr:Uma2 family endonuclease [Gemmataceae bacterium]
MPRTATTDTLAELVHRLGDVPLERIRTRPAPGTAKESHFLAALKRDGYPCELVDGTLVEKPMGLKESQLAIWIAFHLNSYLARHAVGILTGADGAMRLMGGLIRVPDLAFIRASKLPKGVLPDEPLPDLAPCLAVEVLSASNRPGEIKRKLKEYFLAGTELVWIVEPKKRLVRVHSAPDVSVTRSDRESLDGADLLPGFVLPVAAIFDRIPPAGA